MPTNAPRPVIQVTGLSHHTADVELREKFALTGEVQTTVLHRVIELREVEEAVVIDTCNRVELVVSAKTGASPASLGASLESVLSGVSALKPNAFSKHLYHHREKLAVNHLFRVASGLDSLVIGEPQVLGQIKDAYEQASKSGAAGRVLHRLFHRAFRVAKAVRTHTGISQNAVSVCFAARELALQIFGDLRDATVILLGAGDTGALALKHFSSSGVTKFIILNKTVSRASELADLCSGTAASLEHIGEYLHQADVVIGAASLPQNSPYLVSAKQVEDALRARGNKPQLYLDLAVPRNVSPEIDKLSDAFLYNVDDLESVVRENMNSRMLEAQRAEGIISLEVDRFWSWFEDLPLENSIRELAERCADYRSQEVEKTLRRFQRLGIDEATKSEFRQALEDMASGVLAKALHEPLTAIRTRGKGEAELHSFFRRLFLKK